jgi:diadenosine hexaphosphate hydrolase (ATP-forming)
VKRPRPLKGFKTYVTQRRQPAIQDVVRETTAGGVVYRKNEKTGVLEFLLVQDAKDRWTIPKGHVEEGETTKQTARREITEETGLQHINVKNWLGKINFRYRRERSLILMVTHIYLVEATKDTDKLIAEDWMNGIKWFPAAEAVERTAYEGISKLMLLAMKRIRDEK